MIYIQSTGNTDMVRRVFRIFYDFERLEIWLNDMAQQGWMMNSFFMGLFQFTLAAPGEYIYRVEMMAHHAKNPNNLPYWQFLRETGIEIISTWAKWVVYRRKADEGEFNVYSDIESRISHYRRVNHFLFGLCTFEWLLAILQGCVLFESLNTGETKSVWLPIFGLLFAFWVGVAMFRAAWRSQKKVVCLKREKAIRE